MVLMIIPVIFVLRPLKKEVQFLNIPTYLLSSILIANIIIIIRKNYFIMSSRITIN